MRPAGRAREARLGRTISCWRIGAAGAVLWDARPAALRALGYGRRRSVDGCGLCRHRRLAGDERLARRSPRPGKCVALSDGKALRPLNARERSGLPKRCATLAADRDRLQTRLTTLERSLGDIAAQVGAGPVADGAPVGARPRRPRRPPRDRLRCRLPLAQPAARRHRKHPAADDRRPRRPRPSSASTSAAPTPSTACARCGRRRGSATARCSKGLRPLVHRARVARRSIDMRWSPGPTAEAATAARLCATLVAAGAICQPHRLSTGSDSRSADPFDIIVAACLPLFLPTPRQAWPAGRRLRRARPTRFIMRYP